MMAATTVPRETHPPVRKYSQKRGDKTRERLIDGVVAYAGQGSFRVSARRLGQYAGVHHTAVNRHFGAVELLYRVVARRHWQRVLPSLPTSVADCVPDHEAKALVWAVLVGEPRELS